MLIVCPECELQVSDKAYQCPHCGNPMKENTPKRPKNKSRLRLPNGFGQITELKTPNIRNRFRAMVTVGKDYNGKPICKLLKPKAYFSTYNEAYAALVEYNKNPYDLDDDITVMQLYEKWSDEYFKKIKDTSTRTITSAWKYCSSVYRMRVRDVRAHHIKGCMDLGTVEYKGEIKRASASTKERIKSLFNLMLDYALEHDLVDKNYARTFDVPDDVLKEIENEKKQHISFTDDEMKTLWENEKNIAYVNIILFQCYTGFRPQELGLIKLENVDLERNIIIAGIKSEAGRNRAVPIHPKIKRITKELYDKAKEKDYEYLIYCDDEIVNSRHNIKLTYDKYEYRYKLVIDELKLNPEHRAHDPRKQFVTMAKKYKVDEYAIKRIVGHKIKDLTEKTYTDRDIQWLIEEINKIPN